MRILVTGGAGFIGSNIAMALQNRNEVTVLDDFRCGVKENLEEFEGDTIKASITNFDWNSLKNADMILHQAAITDTTVEKDVMEVNFRAFKRLLEFAAARGIDVIYASSAAVYGNGKVPMKEDQEMKPANTYGISKSLMDKAAKEEMEKNRIKIIGLRYFNVFGPNESHKGKSASMIYQLYSQMKSGNPRIFKYGEQKRDFVYVKDVVKANTLAMKCRKSGIFNVGTGIATDFNAIINLLNKSMGTNRKPEYFDNPYSFYQNTTLADLASAKKILGYEPDYTTEEGIKECVKMLSP